MKQSIDTIVFLRTFWLVCISVFMVVCGVNAIVDPFDMFGSKRVEGFNELKPEIGPRGRMAKAYRTRVIEPRGIILGSSRAEIGLDPEHPGWDKESQPVYNLALSSVRIEEIFGYLLHAQAHGPLREVVLALDFYMFNANWRHETDFDPNRLSRPENMSHDMGWIEDVIKALFSLDGLKASIGTIKAQKNPVTASYFSNGLRDTRRNWASIRAKGGHRGAFLANTLYELTQPDGWPLFSLYQNTEPPSPLETFDSVVEFCQQHNIRLHIFISPIHAMKQEIIWQLGLSPQLERWKRDLVAILEDSGIALWDFSGYNSITMEPFPGIGDEKTQMEHYWEGSHYRKHVGDLILDRLFVYQESGRTVPSDFGIALNMSNVDAHLLATREAREYYISRHHAEVEELVKLIQETESKRRAIRDLNRPREEVRQ